MAVSSITNSLNTLNGVSAAKRSTFAQLSSGSKLPEAGYGPAAYAILERTYSEIGALNQSNVNSQNTNAMLRTASGAVENTVSSLTSLREQILNAANGTNGSSDIAALQQSIDQTVQTVDNNALTATYNGKQLLNGKQSVAVAGSDGYTAVTLSNMSAAGLGLVDNNGSSKLDLSSPTGIASALDTVDSALNAALDEATTLGAQQQRLAYQSANYTTSSTSSLESASTVGDADIAKLATKLSSQNTQEQLALYAVKIGMRSNERTLALLQQ